MLRRKGCPSSSPTTFILEQRYWDHATGPPLHGLCLKALASHVPPPHHVPSLRLAQLSSCCMHRGLNSRGFSLLLPQSPQHPTCLGRPLVSQVLILVLLPPQPPILQVITNEDMTCCTSCPQHPHCHNSSLIALSPPCFLPSLDPGPVL